MNKIYLQIDVDIAIGIKYSTIKKANLSALPNAIQGK